MINLVDGKGQLGEELNKYVFEPNYTTLIYHTWNFQDKTEVAQKECYDKFVKWVDYTDVNGMALISTYTKNWTPYLKYKMKAELYLLENVTFAKVYRLPNLIGKGVCQGFKDGALEPDKGEIEIISIRDAALAIIEDLKKLEWQNKIVRIRGTVTTPETVYNLIRFGGGM